MLKIKVFNAVQCIVCIKIKRLNQLFGLFPSVKFSSNDASSSVATAATAAAAVAVAASKSHNARTTHATVLLHKHNIHT